jgi:hypothetical protein
MPNHDAIQESLRAEADFKLENHGSLFLLRPLNSAAKQWLQEHLPVGSHTAQVSCPGGFPETVRCDSVASAAGGSVLV